MVRAVVVVLSPPGSFDCASRDETGRGFAQDDPLLMDDVFDFAPVVPICPSRYLRREPSSMSSESAKVASMGLPDSPLEAARSMPWDSRPRILRGARLAMMTMRRPMSSSGVYHSAMPERIWRFS